jgi:DtxR family Mn-dependent transcriptional regulator
MTVSTGVQLTSSLEDYLETIYQLVRDNKVARVKEIARLRKVKPGSVSPAMKRLSELGLIKYEQREFIDLTPAGEKAARRILSRHNLLHRFFVEILGMEDHAAEEDACAMEHSLSNDAMDRLAGLFEYIKISPDQNRHFLTRFNKYLDSHSTLPKADGQRNRQSRSGPGTQKTGRLTIAGMSPGEVAKVKNIHAVGPLRQKLLEMGILSEVKVLVERKGLKDGGVLISVQGFQITLSREEAESVLVSEPAE